MQKKFGLFEDSDLFFAKKHKSIYDGTKMIKFKGSKIIAISLVFISILIPY
jgi:hypothetical protein